MKLSKLNDKQREAVLHMEGPCRVIAGAGSGKTTVLTYRIENLINNNVNPNSILAITFTKKSATEMKERLFSLIGQKSKNVFLGTFHSFGYRLLNAEKNKNLNLIQEIEQRQIIRKIIAPYSKIIDQKNTYNENVVLSFISWQKNYLLTPKDELDMSILENEEDRALIDEYRKIYSHYEKIKKEQEKLDIDDMLIEAYHLLKKDKNTREKYQNIFKYILVDEFQDTNKAQYQLIKLLAQKHQNIFIVGDARQAIYSWRAAKVEFILNFENDWKNAKTIPLDDNYRSSIEIVDLSNEIIKASTIDYPGFCVSGKKNHSDKPVTIISENDELEAENIGNIILSLKEANENFSFKNVFILYRLNIQSKPFEDYFISNNIPYHVNGSPGFYGKTEIQEILSYLKLLVYPNDIDSLKKIYNVPFRGLDKKFLEEVEKLADFYNMSLMETISLFWDKDVSKSKGSLVLQGLFEELSSFIQNDYTVDKLILEIRKLTNYDQHLIDKQKGTEHEDDASKIDILNAFTESCSKYKSIEDLLEYISKVEEQQKNPTKDKVQLMTFHKSKGLEADTVFLVGWVNGLVPHKKSCMYNNNNELILSSVEEERRLAYVGITRAKEKLYISSFLKSGNSPVVPSVFLNEIIKSTKVITPSKGVMDL